MKLPGIPGELYCLVPLVLLWWRYLRTDFLHSRIPNYFCQTAVQPKKSSFSLSYFITVNFLFVAYVEDSVDSSSIVTNQLEEPTSPLDSSTKSVDELLQVFILLCVAYAYMRYMAANASCMMMFFVLLFLLVCLIFLCVDLYKFVLKLN